jgi:hypothetical protein
MGTQCLGYSWATLSPWVINTETWSSWLGAGLTIQPCKKVIVTNPQWGGQGPNWAVEPYDDEIKHKVGYSLVKLILQPTVSVRFKTVCDTGLFRARVQLMQ